MRSSSYAPGTPARRSTRAVLVLALTAAMATTLPAARAATPTAATPATTSTAGAEAVAAKPYMGWTSWSMQSSKYPGLNPDGDYSYLTEANVLKQTDAMAAKLKPYGYEYVNIDAGWWRGQGLEAAVRRVRPAEGRPGALPARHEVRRRPHPRQGPQGRHLPAGRPGEGGVRRRQTPDLERRGLHHRRHRLPRPAHHQRLGQRLQDRLLQPLRAEVHRLAGAAVRRLGLRLPQARRGRPGFRARTATNYDNVADVAAWQKAIATTGRPIHLELSWSLDIGHVADWKKYSNGWRIDTDVECYCNTLVSWENSVDDRWDDAPGLDPPRRPRRLERPRLPQRRQRRDGRPHQGRAAELRDPVGHRQVPALHRRRPDQARLLRPVAADQPRGHRDQPEQRAARRAGHRRPTLSRCGRRRTPTAPTPSPCSTSPTRPPSVTADWSTLGFNGKASVRDLWNRANLGTHKNKITAGPARARLPPVHRHPPRHRSRLDRLRGRGGREHPQRQRLRRRLLRLLRRPEGRQPLRRRQAPLQRRRRAPRPAPTMVKVAYVSGDARSIARLRQRRRRQPPQVPLHRGLGHRRDASACR